MGISEIWENGNWIQSKSYPTLYSQRKGIIDVYCDNYEAHWASFPNGIDNYPNPDIRIGNVKVYPNPANESLEASYQLPIASFVNICLFDIMGRQVENILNENQVTGEHVVNIKTQSLADGVYILRFSVKDFVANRKIVVKH